MANLFQSVLRLNGTAVAGTHAASHAHFQRYLQDLLFSSYSYTSYGTWGQDRRRIPGPPHQDKKVTNRCSAFDAPNHHR